MRLLVLPAVVVMCLSGSSPAASADVGSPIHRDCAAWVVGATRSAADTAHVALQVMGPSPSTVDAVTLRLDDRTGHWLYDVTRSQSDIALPRAVQEPLNLGVASVRVQGVRKACDPSVYVVPSPAEAAATASRPAGVVSPSQHVADEPARCTEPFAPARAVSIAPPPDVDNLRMDQQTKTGTVITRVTLQPNGRVQTAAILSSPWSWFDAPALAVARNSGFSAATFSCSATGGDYVFFVSLTMN